MMSFCTDSTDAAVSTGSLLTALRSYGYAQFSYAATAWFVPQFASQLLRGQHKKPNILLVAHFP